MNPVKGEAELALKDGRTLKLVLDMEAMVAAEASYGKPLQQTMKDAQAGFVGASRAILHGALSAHHPEVSATEALTILQTDSEAVMKALTDAGERAFPSASKEGGDKTNPPGKSSGRNGAKRA